MKKLFKYVEKILGSYKYWTQEETFDNEECALNKIEKDWKYRRNYLTKEGDKSIYVCNQNKLCKAEIRLFYENESEKVLLYKNNVEHDHSKCDEINWGISKASKEEIESLYKSGVKKPKLLQYALRKKSIDVPTIMQINNWLRYYKKKEFGSTNITFAELEAWCTKRLKLQRINTNHLLSAMILTLMKTNQN